jgi:uncharacterized membrane protein YdfJ with MMPL/SSD domain
MDSGANAVTTLPDRFSSKRAFVALQRDFPAATTDPVRIIVSEGHNEASVSEACNAGSPAIPVSAPA